jgi:hypothetical protein
MPRRSQGFAAGIRIYSNPRHIMKGNEKGAGLLAPSVTIQHTTITGAPASKWKVPSEFRTHLMLCLTTHPFAIAA